jgi:hypothetical protein
MAIPGIGDSPPFCQTLQLHTSKHLNNTFNLQLYSSLSLLTMFLAALVTGGIFDVHLLAIR